MITTRLWKYEQAVTFELWLADVDRFTHDGGVQQRLLSLSSE